MQTWDFFIAHAGPDRAHASELYDELRKAGCTEVFLDAQQLAPGEPWPTALKRALSHSRVSVVLVSSNSDAAWYQQEEVALAINLVRDDTVAHTIVPVFLPGAEIRHAPYGIGKLHGIVMNGVRMPSVATRLIQVLSERPQRASTQMFAGAVSAADELFTNMEPGLTGAEPRDVRGLHVRYAADGTDVVAYDQGSEVARINRADFESKLPAEALEQIEVLERSMEANKSIWRDKYPNRVLSKDDRKMAEDAARALAEDLSGVLRLIEQSGLVLDDHYIVVRDIVSHYLPNGGSE